MIKPYVITQSDVKTYLNITDTTYDTLIDLYIPDVTDDLTRKNGICNQSFLLTGTATADGTDTLTDVSICTDELYIGSSIYINGEDGVIASYTEDTITLESALTSSGDYDLYVRNFPRGARSVVAKMVMYKVSETGTGTELAKSVTSKSIGPLSVSFADDSGNVSLDRFGYPESLTKALKTIRKPRFF